MCSLKSDIKVKQVMYISEKKKKDNIITRDMRYLRYEITEHIKERQHLIQFITVLHI